jgi:hypothetical protein
MAVDGLEVVVVHESFLFLSNFFNFGGSTFDSLFASWTFSAMLTELGSMSSGMYMSESM